MTEEADKWDFIRTMFCADCNENEFKVFQHLVETYNLDPVSKEIWCIKDAKHPNTPARIFVSRDGHLAIAQRTGNYGGMHTVFDFGPEPQYMEIRDRYTREVTGRVLVPFSATTTINRKDSPYPTEHTVFWDEYGSTMSLWASKPKTMLQKVAECQCLRRAFDMHGFYAPEEFVDDKPSLSAEGKMIEDEEKNLDRNGSAFVSRKEREAVVDKMETTNTVVNPPQTASSEVKKPQQTRQEKIQAVTDAAFEIYDKEGFETAKNLFTTYCLNLDVLEKAKIGDGQWNKTMIIEDFQKQMKEKSGGK